MPASFETKNNEVSLISTHALKMENRILLELKARGRIRGILNSDKIKALLKGKTIIKARKALAGLNEVADYKIESVSKTLPAFGFQIRLVFPAGAKEHVRP
jgi:hypothetical protein